MEKKRRMKLFRHTNLHSDEINYVVENPTISAVASIQCASRSRQKWHLSNGESKKEAFKRIVRVETHVDSVRKRRS